MYTVSSKIEIRSK